MSRRMLGFRLLAVLALLALGGVMLVIGRGHYVYLDNKTLEYDGAEYHCPYKVEVIVKGERAAKLYERERGEADCIGQTLRMDLLVTEEKGGEEVTRTVTVKLPYAMDAVVVNLPGLLAGLPPEAYLTEFVQAAPVEEDTEKPEDSLDGDGLGLGDV